MTNTLKFPAKEVDNMHCQMGNFSRDNENCKKKNLMKLLKVKNTVTRSSDIKIVIDRLISRLDRAKGRIGELEIIQIERE